MILYQGVGGWRSKVQPYKQDVEVRYGETLAFLCSTGIDRGMIGHVLILLSQV